MSSKFTFHPNDNGFTKQKTIQSFDYTTDPLQFLNQLLQEESCLLYFSYVSGLYHLIIKYP